MRMKDSGCFAKVMGGGCDANLLKYTSRYPSATPGIRATRQKKTGRYGNACLNPDGIQGIDKTRDEIGTIRTAMDS